ncbi:MAG TPA: ornithine carbamoyltransferase [Syntrophobacteraceae bacterium]|nr:ornithine carbamoyltransferase [Syntrophobacteraceae bacterium]
MKRDLLTILDLTAAEILALLARARKMKGAWFQGALRPTLQGKTLGLLFTKPSTRTRISFEAAMNRLGGSCIFMTAKDTQLSRQEPLADMARVMSRYIEAVAVRTYDHADVEDLARHATIPIINALTDSYHPCQVLSDLLTIQEKRGSLDNLQVAWVGDGNNVAHSWINAAARVGFTLRLACPEGYLPDARVVEKARSEGGRNIFVLSDPGEAVAAADAVNTDVWASMGQEEESELRRRVFAPYQVNAALLSRAPTHAMVMHCLPAHREEEITGEVLEGPRSVVFDQAENRLHAQKALLLMMLS